jgi:hypothetical protein
MTTLVYDIETGPLPELELAALLPPFDPAEVKTGNIKDPEKVAAKIAEAEAAHRRDFFDRAALDPLTGRVLAVGVLYPDSREYLVIGDDDERQVLREFWNLSRGEMGRINQMVGFNCHLFDLPFMVRRSWKHRIPVPAGIRRGRYWSEQMVDLRDEWQLGDRQARGSLDSIAKHLGLGEKTGCEPHGPPSGKAFAQLWQTDRAQARSYLRNDVELTAKMGEVLGAVECAA